jgi:hypothetical protein
MFGTFTEEALARYGSLVQQDYKEKRVRGGQGTEYADNLGVGETDNSFIDADESQNIDDYSEWDDWSFATCLRPDGTLYGIGGGKCRKGREISADAVARLKEERKTPKQKQREAIQKRGVKAVTKAKAEKVLAGVQNEGKKEKERNQKAFERRAKGDGFARSRTEQIQVLVGKATESLDRLLERRRRVKKEGEYSKGLDARIARLRGTVGKLQAAKQRLQEQNMPKGEGFGRIPAAYETGRGLA